MRKTTEGLIQQVDVGDTFDCDAAQLLDDKVLVRRDGVWIELRVPSVDRVRTALEGCRWTLKHEGYGPGDKVFDDLDSALGNAQS